MTKMITAQEEYERTTVEIKRTLAGIDRLLKMHKQKARRYPRHYGNVGDMKHVEAQLNDIYNFLYGDDDE